MFIYFVVDYCAQHFNYNESKILRLLVFILLTCPCLLIIIYTMFHNILRRFPIHYITLHYILATIHTSYIYIYTITEYNFTISHRMVDVENVLL